MKKNKTKYVFDISYVPLDATDIEICWSTAAIHAWNWLTMASPIRDKGLLKLMPPIHIDDDPAPSGKKKYALMDIEVESRKMAVDLDHGMDFITVSKNIAYEIVPVSYRCNIHHEHIMHYIRNFFGGNPPLVVLLTVMMHLLLHEFVHYIDIINYDQRRIANYDKEDLEYSSKWNSIIGSRDNEISTELRAIKLATDMLLRPYSTMAVPILGERYDLYMRSKSETYNLISRTLESMFDIMMVALDYYDDDIVDKKIRAYRENTDYIIEWSEKHPTNCKIIPE